MKYFQMRPGISTATIAAGSKLGFIANSQVTHFGPISFYMAKMPAGADINNWDPSENFWFKAAVLMWCGPEVIGLALPILSFALEPFFGLYMRHRQNETTDKEVVDFVIPKNSPSGMYLVRVESIALHQAQSVGGAQVSLRSLALNK